MKVPLFNLDYTLDSGQVFRWWKEDRWWHGVVDNQYIQLQQDGDYLRIRGTSEDTIAHYFRFDDNLEEIYAEISKDESIDSIIDNFRGLRLIRQDVWECTASYILATYSNVPRIKGMVDSVCRAYGREIEDGIFSFPTPEEILEGDVDIACCRLGYRADWFLGLASMAYSGEFDICELTSRDYRGAIEYLKKVKGIGNKVADCVALFSLNHLQACPVDVRIARAMRDIYGITGSYDKVASYAREHFGRFAGYAQEYLYISEGRAGNR
ncbi:MAG: DNA-3-methyladenine glycosylase 2 family protein [Euryarchaeota archaeon]|nr:DNA-3-methyladenine glycosylase 2 family protein [Euryarchaeota archaeon]